MILQTISCRTQVLPGKKINLSNIFEVFFRAGKYGETTFFENWGGKAGNWILTL